VNDIDRCNFEDSMKPTVYLPLADLCPTGLRRASTRSAVRFTTAGRISARRLWVERQGRQVGRNEHKSTTTVAGNSGERRIA
jgi:hypothetical protein